MAANFLKLNPDKTEFMLLANKTKQVKFSSLFPVNILGEQISPKSAVCNMGVVFDSDFTFSQHVSKLCKSCWPHLRDFRRIRPLLDRSTATIVANALVSSRIDYCNSLLHCLKIYDLNRLERIQKTLCRIVCRIPRLSSVSAAMKSLHWLPLI